MKMAYPACFYPENNGSYSVIFPDLNYCATQGKNLMEAMEMAEDAASGYLLVSLEQGEPFPASSQIKGIVPDSDDGFVSMVLIDLDAYAKKHNDKTVKKTLTIPAWVNEAAERRGINFSSTLKDAIIDQLSL